MTNVSLLNITDQHIMSQSYFTLINIEAKKLENYMETEPTEKLLIKTGGNYVGSGIQK